MPPKDAAAPAKTKKATGSSKTNAVQKKVSEHPPTMVMVKKALTALDNRKGVSLQAIRTYLTEKYPSTDQLRSKYLVRRALTKGIEDGTLKRPHNTSVMVHGVQGRFQLVKEKVKMAKKSSENSDPNVDNVVVVKRNLQHLLHQTHIDLNFVKGKWAESVLCFLLQ